MFLYCLVFAALLQFCHCTIFGAPVPSNTGEFGHATVISPSGVWLAFSECAAGNVHLFDFISGTWAFSQTISSSTSDSRFGESLSLSNDALVIGVPDFYPLGELKVYKLDDFSNTWNSASVSLVCSTCTIYSSELSKSVSLYGNTSAVGAPADYYDGVVLILKTLDDGSSWTTMQELSNVERTFGNDVSLYGNYLAISAAYFSDAYVMFYSRTSELDSFIFLKSTSSSTGASGGISLSNNYLAYVIATTVTLIDWSSDTTLLTYGISGTSGSHSTVALSMSCDGTSGVLAFSDYFSYSYTYSTGFLSGSVVVYQISSATQLTLVNNIYDMYGDTNFGYSVAVPSYDEVGFSSMFVAVGSPTIDLYDTFDAGAGFTCDFAEYVCNSVFADGLNYDDDVTNDDDPFNYYNDNSYNYYYYDDDSIETATIVILASTFSSIGFCFCIVFCIFMFIKRGIKTSAFGIVNSTLRKPATIIVTTTGIQHSSQPPQIPLVNMNQTQGMPLQQVSPSSQMGNAFMQPQQMSSVAYAPTNMQQQPQMMYQPQSMYPQSNMNTMNPMMNYGGAMMIPQTGVIGSMNGATQIAINGGYDAGFNNCFNNNDEVGNQPYRVPTAPYALATPTNAGFASAMPFVQAVGKSQEDNADSPPNYTKY